MRPVFPLLAVSYLLLVGVVALLATLGVRCGRAAVTGVVVAELILVLNAAVDVTALLRGHRPAALATHLGYLLCSVALLPFLVSRPPRRFADGPGWTRPRHAVLALACAVTAVVVVRQQQTLE